MDLPATTICFNLCVEAEMNTKTDNESMCSPKLKNPLIHRGKHKQPKLNFFAEMRMARRSPVRKGEHLLLRDVRDNRLMETRRLKVARSQK